MLYFVTMILTSTVISMNFDPSCSTSNDNVIPLDMESLKARYNDLIEEVKDLTKEYEELTQKKLVGEASINSEHDEMLRGISEKLDKTKGELGAIKAKTIEIVKDISPDIEFYYDKAIVRKVGSIPIGDFTSAYKIHYIMHRKSMGDLYKKDASLSENTIETMEKVNVFIRQLKWRKEKGEWYIVREPDRMAEYRIKLGAEIHAMINRVINELDNHLRNSDIEPNHEFANYKLIDSTTKSIVPFEVAISTDLILYIERFKSNLEDCDCDEKVAIMDENYLRTCPW